MYLDNERRPTLTPQLAVRVAILGGIALAAFAVIFFRLWFLQVLSGDKYVAEAQNNQLREIKVQAPRGDIVDREGRVLVRNRVGNAVKITPDRLSEDEGERRVLYRRLAKLLRMRPAVIERRVEEQFYELPFSTATVKQDVPRDVVMYLGERREDFRGVTVEPVFLREYPHRELAAHLLGYVGEVSAEELDDPTFAGVEMGDRVRAEQPEQGKQLRLSLDLDVQRVGQAALAGGTGRGAFAVMDVKSGEVL